MRALALFALSIALTFSPVAQSASVCAMSAVSGCMSPDCPHCKHGAAAGACAMMCAAASAVALPVAPGVVLTTPSVSLPRSHELYRVASCFPALDPPIPR